MTSDETGMVAIFQSTLPREERPVRRYSLPLISVNFNPRSHERSDHITQSFVFRFFNFNPRSHERSDSFSSAILSLCTNFNPRSHERGDSYMICLPYYDIISIHAPTRGATITDIFKYTANFDFNPRSHERSDVKEGEILLVIDISIHAPTRGATSSLKPLETYHCSFQSTLPREERRIRNI